MISATFIPASLIMGYMDETYSILYAIGYLVAQLFIMSAVGFWLWARGVRKQAAI